MPRTLPTVLACVALATVLGGSCAVEGSEKPKDLGLIEKAGIRLVQIDLSVTKRDGSPVAIQPGDLKVQVGKSTLGGFTLDRICTPRAPAVPETRTQAIATYLFYFDEPHLTYSGRARSMEVARELVETLIVGGNRGMVISNGRDLLALSPLTDDSADLLAAIDRLQRDTSRQERFAEEEATRVARLEAGMREAALQAKEQDDAYTNVWSVQEEGLNCSGPNPDPLCRTKQGKALDKNNPVRLADANRAASLFKQGAWREVEGTAKYLQREEQQYADSALDRFRLALLRLVPVEAPKAVVYFADTMRLNAGEHYLRSVAKVMEQEGVFGGAGPEFARSGGIRDVAGSFDRVVAMAGGVGARVYAVLAQGTAADSGGLRDAKDALSILAADTGGRAFLEGVGPSAIAGSIADDMECVYLVSFEPKGFPEDRPLPVRIKATRKDTIVRTRSQIVIPSEKAMAESIRLAAFLNPRANGASLTLGLVPAGFDGKRYSELLQLAVPDGGMAGTVWRFTATTIAAGRVVEEFDRTVTTEEPGQPLVVEHVLSLPPGSYETVALAENTTAAVLYSGQLNLDVPEAMKDGASVTALVALQPEIGLFLRDDDAPRKSGPLVQIDGAPLRPERPTALVAYVCRGKGEKAALRVDRQLVGQSAVTFKPVVLDQEGDPCAQVRDMIPAATLGAGAFQYVVTVLRGGERLATAQRQVVVARAPTTGP